MSLIYLFAVLLLAILMESILDSIKASKPVKIVFWIVFILFFIC